MSVLWGYWLVADLLLPVDHLMGVGRVMQPSGR